MRAPDVKTPPGAVASGKAVEVVNIKGNGSRHGRSRGLGIHAYERHKAMLTGLDLAPGDYMRACREAARVVGV